MFVRTISLEICIEIGCFLRGKFDHQSLLIITKNPMLKIQLLGLLNLKVLQKLLYIT